jgi:hypothetical protein
MQAPAPAPGAQAVSFVQLTRRTFWSDELLKTDAARRVDGEEGSAAVADAAQPTPMADIISHS